MDDGPAVSLLGLSDDSALSLSVSAFSAQPDPVERQGAESADMDAVSGPDPAPTMRLVKLDAEEPNRPPHPLLIEALLFASDAPLSANKLAELIGVTNINVVRLAVEELNTKYLDARLAFRIESIAGGYQMMTLPIFKPWLARLAKQRSETRLSDAAMEALSVVAYKQPVTRADVEAIRGVACGEVLNRLREMGLVRIAGRAEVVGRPILYATTKKFLDIFGLASLEDLPPMEALALRRKNAGGEPPAAERA